MTGLTRFSSATLDTVDNVCPAPSSILIGRQERSDIGEPSVVPKAELFSTGNVGGGAEQSGKKPLYA